MCQYEEIGIVYFYLFSAISIYYKLILQNVLNKRYTYSSSSSFDKKLSKWNISSILFYYVILLSPKFYKNGGGIMFN